MPLQSQILSLSIAQVVKKMSQQQNGIKKIDSLTLQGFKPETFCSARQTRRSRRLGEN
jgi:hypothetical protein